MDSLDQVHLVIDAQVSDWFEDEDDYAAAQESFYASLRNILSEAGVKVASISDYESGAQPSNAYPRLLCDCTYTDEYMLDKQIILEVRDTLSVRGRDRVVTLDQFSLCSCSNEEPYPELIKEALCAFLRRTGERQQDLA